MPMSNRRLAQLRHYRDLWDDDWQLMAEAMEHEPIGLAMAEAVGEIDRLLEVARLAAEYIADESAGSMEFWRAYEPGEH